VLRIVNEPTAAALAYGLDLRARDGEEATEKASKILIFDLGGGTFDVSVLRIEGGVFEVLATGGDTHLGGEDFDNALVDWVCQQVKRSHGIELRENKGLLKRTRVACERAKRSLSSSVEVPLVIERGGDTEDITLRLSRATFEKLNAAPFDKCILTVKNVMKDAGASVGEVAQVVLVGGSTRIPKVQQQLKDFFKGKELCRSIDPDEAVAYGAAVQGAVLSGLRHAATEALLLLDVTPLSLGIELSGKVMSTVIKRNTSIPCRATKSYSTDEDFQTGIEVRVFEGERSTTDGNNLLGQFEISGIERARRGEPKIEVTFQLDADGILRVSARDTRTGANASTTITNAKGRHSQEEVERMVADAERMRRIDEERVAAAELRGEYRDFVDWARDQGADVDADLAWLREHGDTAPLADMQRRFTATRTRVERARDASGTTSRDRKRDTA
jgi:heat shock 70kDa protein 1/2/6/8